MNENQLYLIGCTKISYFCVHSGISFFYPFKMLEEEKIKQAGAELYQAQFKLRLAMSVT